MKHLKLQYLSVRTAFCIGLLLLAFLLFLALTLWGHLPRGTLALLGLLLLLLCASSCCLLLLRPYTKTKRQLRGMLDLDRPEHLLAGHIGFAPLEDTLLRRLARQFDRQEMLKLEIKESEILALQNQINPHFLYNTLEAIRSDALVYGADDIAAITESLGTFFRYTISSLDRLVSLADEIHNIEDYFLIQQYRFGDDLKMEIAFSRHQTEMEQLYMPKMTLQPIIENAIFHGLEAQNLLGCIRIHIDRTPTVLLICIEDNGIGMSDEQIDALNASLSTPVAETRRAAPRRGGIALQNIHHRIQLLFGKEYGLHLLSAQGVGTEAWLTLPICTQAHYEI